MKRIMLATIAGAALLAGASAASAQTYYDGGYYNNGPFVERGVGLQLGPVGVGIYDNGPVYDGYTTYRRAPQSRDNSVYESNSFRAQEFYPQSPPGGGY
jgi:hypothetical protein